MNERIRELYIKTLNEECSNPALVDIEKFAELIVRECLDILDDEDDTGYESRGVRIAAYRIKKHFGVEECLKND